MFYLMPASVIQLWQVVWSYLLLNNLCVRNRSAKLLVVVHSKDLLLLLLHLLSLGFGISVQEENFSFPSSRSIRFRSQRAVPVILISISCNPLVGYGAD